MKEKNNKIQNKGITLIALVITIIVMLILVTVTITMAVNGNLFEYAGKAAKDTELLKQEEQKIAEGSIEVDKKKYNTIDEYIDLNPQYSESLLNSNGTLTKTVEYIDENNETAIIPTGFGIVEGCEIINQGLVISDKFDNKGKSIGNEFVWIPVPEKDMQVATLSNPYVNGNYAEPRKLTKTDSETSSQTGGPFEYDSQEELDYYYGENYFTYVNDFIYEDHYKEMAESVNKYGGFYIGRYETTIDSNNNIGSKVNTTVLTSDRVINGTNTYRWWGLYYAQRNANVIGTGNTIQTNMIWGQQWDKMIKYFYKNNIDFATINTSIYSKPSGVLASGQATYINTTDSTDVIYDKVFNIYDLRGNELDWTAEAVSTNFRTYRGGYYVFNGSAGSRNMIYSNSEPTGKILSYGTRLTLYIL